MKKLTKKQKFYETVAPLKYDTRFEKIPFYELWEFRLYQKLVNDLPPSFSILDLGCGTGRLVKAFPHQSYLGVDTSRSLVAFAQKKYRQKGRSFLVLDYQKDLGRLPRAKFDLILLIGTFEDAPNPVGEASALLDKLSKGGKIIFTAWNQRNWLARAFNYWEKKRAADWYWEKTYFGLPELKKELKRLALEKKVSFSLTSKWVIPLGLFQKLQRLTPKFVSRWWPVGFSFLEAINFRLGLGLGSDWVVLIKKPRDQSPGR